jgi:hypothetical protein
MKRILILAALALVTVYVCDYVILHLKMSAKNQGAAFGVVTIQPYYAIPHKDGKAEFMFGDPQNQTCVHSLFPHSGYPPCWYLSRKSVNATQM